MTDGDAGLVTVDLGPRSYPIRVVDGDPAGFGPFARAALDASWSGRGCRQGLIVTDENLAPWAPRLVGALKRVGIAADVAVIPPGEASKRLDRAAGLYDPLIAMKADRHACIVALGGGVVGDLAGFVAATYARGLPLLMVPTSLLAQVDSSVGGKVGVNHPRAKNIIGAFHQPAGVWIDTESLATLPPRELRCGLAEVVKYGVILDAGFFAFLEENGPGHRGTLEPGGDPARSSCRSCELKAEVVSLDEREETGPPGGPEPSATRSATPSRPCPATAVPSCTARRWPWGWSPSARLAERLGWIEPDVTTARLTSLLRQFGLPAAAPGLDPDALISTRWAATRRTRAGRIRFVLPRDRSAGSSSTDAPGDAATSARR